MIFVHDTPTNRLLNMVLGAMTGGKLVEATATGNPLTFITDKAKPLKSLLIPFTPQQSGTGDPSPENIRSILPWNGLTVFGCGKNLLDDTKRIKNNTNVTVFIGQTVTTVYPLFLKAGEYTISAEFDDGYHYAMYYKEQNKNQVQIWSKGGTDTEKTFTIENDGNYRFWLYDNNGIDETKIGRVWLNTGETALPYEPYTPITETDISFPSPVYGGTLDVVSGVLSVEYAEVILKGTEEWFESENKFFVTSVSALKNNTAKQNIFCDLFKYSLNGADYLLQGQFTDSISSAYNIRIRKHDDAMTLQEFRSLLASNNMHIVYKLETPTEQTLTGHQITALIGDNTIWSDADGQMTATYLKKG